MNLGKTLSLNFYSCHRERGGAARVVPGELLVGYSVCLVEIVYLRVSAHVLFFLYGAEEDSPVVGPVGL